MTPASLPNDDSIPRAALEGLGLALFVRRDDGSVRLAGAAPAWLSRVWPSVATAEGSLAETSAFLDNFLIDAAVCWSARIGQVRSGPWVEYDREGAEINLEATALTGGGRSLLLIERLGEEFEATRSMLQRARETVLAYQRLAQPRPPEIGISLARLRDLYPDYAKCGVLMMRFAGAKPYTRILSVIEETARAQGLTVVLADAHDFHGDLLSNVRTYLHGCSFGIAVYERIESDEHNANVGFEVGYLMALNKPVLLLKDRTLPSLHADLAGRLYRTFDPHDPEGTIPQQLIKWFQDHGIVVSKSG